MVVCTRLQVPMPALFNALICLGITGICSTPAWFMDGWVKDMAAYRTKEPKGNWDYGWLISWALGKEEDGKVQVELFQCPKLFSVVPHYATLRSTLRNKEHFEFSRPLNSSHQFNVIIAILIVPSSS